MPRKTKKEWKHPLYAIGYCYERYGKVYLRVKDKKKATHLVWDDRNKAEAIELLENFIKSQIYEIKEEFTISYVMPKFLEHIKNSTSIRNYNDTIARLGLLIKSDFELVDTIAIREHIQSNIFEMQKTRKHNTMVHIVSKAKAFFNYAISNEYMLRNPISKQMSSLMVRSEHYTPTNEEFELVINELMKNPATVQIAYVCRFIRLTAVRIAEADSIKWIDINDESIKIYGKRISEKQVNIRLFTLKPFPEILELLNEIKEQKFTNEYVFGGIDRNNSATKINKACLNVGVQKFQFHAIRRLAIDNWKNLGINRTDRAILAGHDEAVQKANYELEENLKELTERLMKQKK